MRFSRAALRVMLAASMTLSGCATGHKIFYKPAPGATPESIASVRAGPPPAVPIVERAQPDEPQAILDAYAKRGYIMIGSSSFNSSRPASEASAVSQAQEVGADLVLILNPKDLGPVNLRAPIATQSRAAAYRSGEMATSQYAMVTFHQSEYTAVYFVKRSFGLGAFGRDLNDSERQERQSNKGAVVRLVVDGSPAFNADLLVGDIVVSIDGVSVTNAQAFGDMLRERRGKPVTIAFFRNGQRIEKLIQLGP